ncbi:MAG: periplasmic heavy metal sensor [Caldimicrobium sp.]
MRERFLKVLGVGGLLGGLVFTSLMTDVSSKAWGIGPQSNASNVTPAAQAQSVIPNETYLKFYQDTQALRQKIWQTRDELRMLYLQPNPDWQAISEKRATLAQLTTELQKKALEYGLPNYFVRGMGMKMGKSGFIRGARMGICAW